MAVLVDLVMEVLLVEHQHMVVSKEDMDNSRPCVCKRLVCSMQAMCHVKLRDVACLESLVKSLWSR